MSVAIRAEADGARTRLVPAGTFDLAHAAQSRLETGQEFDDTLRRRSFSTRLETRSLSGGWIGLEPLRSNRGSNRCHLPRGIRRVAPCTAEIAAARPHKDRRHAGQFTFALDGIKYFGNQHRLDHGLLITPGGRNQSRPNEG